jgi:hypothetical protein
MKRPLKDKTISYLPVPLPDEHRKILKRMAKMSNRNEGPMVAHLVAQAIKNMSLTAE